MDPQLPIAIFDSGVGGLSIFQALTSLLPSENVIYLADNKRVPYGNLSSETIVQYTSEAISFLETKKVKLVVLGCHTASSRCLYNESVTSFQERFSVPIMGVIEGSLQVLKQRSDFRRLAVLGTNSTIQSGVYENLIRFQNPQLDVVSIACPLLVPMIESGLWMHPDTESLVRSYLLPLQKEPLDAVLLACTHYPLIKGMIQKILGEYVVLLDSSDYTSFAVRDYLSEKDLLNHSNKPHYQFCVTDTPRMFSRRISLFLGAEYDSHLVRL